MEEVQGIVWQTMFTIFYVYGESKSSPTVDDIQDSSVKSTLTKVKYLYETAD